MWWRKAHAFHATATNRQFMNQAVAFSSGAGTSTSQRQEDAGRGLEDSRARRRRAGCKRVPEQLANYQRHVAHGRHTTPATPATEPNKIRINVQNTLCR
jgi:hypothetical protein